MKPILFLTIPNTSLLMKKAKDGLGLSMGACFVSGALEAAGFEVDYFDLNLALNSHRKTDYTSEHVLKFLSKQELFKSAFFTESIPKEIQEYLNHILKLLPKRDYSSISFSLDRRDYYSFANKVTFCFSFLLAKELKKIYSCPIFMGGNRVLNSLGEEYTNSILRSIDSSPIDKISKVSSMKSYAHFLKEVSNGLPVNSPEADALFHKKDGISTANGMKPKYNIINKSDLFAASTDFFPEEIIKKFPALFEIEPLFIAPYKFSVGCPFTCAFCSDGKDMHYRQHRPDSIVSVLGTLANEGIRNFSFFNNNINLNQFFLDQLESGLAKNNIKIQFSDSANLQMASPKVFSQLSRMGCIKLWYGTETLSDRLLKIIDKDLNREKIEAGLDAAHGSEIWNCCNFIHTFPHETNEEFTELLAFISTSNKFDAYSINQFRLLTRSAYFSDPEKYGIKIREVSKNGIVAIYDQIEGKTWEENSAIGKIRQKLASAPRRPIESMVAQNDHILFSLKNLGLKNMQIREIMFYLSNHLRNHELLTEYDHKHTYTIPAEKFDKTPVGTEFGQDMADHTPSASAPF